MGGRERGLRYGSAKEQMEYADYALATWPTYANANYFRKVQLNISPDSLDRIISDLERQALAYEHTQPVMAAVLNAVLGQVYCSDSRYGDEQHSKGMACFEKSLSKPLMLAATKTKEYEPFVEKGIDSRMFNHDLLSVIGYHAAENGYSEAYRIMHKFYKEQGNRLATMLTACAMARPRNRWSMPTMRWPHGPPMPMPTTSGRCSRTSPVRSIWQMWSARSARWPTAVRWR